MTEWRNIKYRNFPKPEKINGRNFYTQHQVDFDIPEWFKSRDENRL